MHALVTDVYRSEYTDCAKGEEVFITKYSNSVTRPKDAWFSTEITKNRYKTTWNILVSRIFHNFAHVIETNGLCWLCYKL